MGTGTILQVVSGFRPETDGMGDFARLLGDTLDQRHSLRSHFLVYRRPEAPRDSGANSPDVISYPSESSLSAFGSRLKELVEQNSFEFALIHYGPYAYTRDGKPGAFCPIIED